MRMQIFCDDPGRIRVVTQSAGTISVPRDTKSIDALRVALVGSAFRLDKNVYVVGSSIPEVQADAAVLCLRDLRGN
jgi:hypothetical protein